MHDGKADRIAIVHVRLGIIHTIQAIYMKMAQEQGCIFEVMIVVPLIRNACFLFLAPEMQDGMRGVFLDQATKH